MVGKGLKGTRGGKDSKQRSNNQGWCNVIKQVCKMPNWKSPGLDYIHGFCLKNV